MLVVIAAREALSTAACVSNGILRLREGQATPDLVDDLNEIFQDYPAPLDIQPRR